MADTYYQDHWLEIEPERIERYERMFEWRPEQDALISGAQLEPGLAVLDYGSGPGYLTLELGRRVAPDGAAMGVDINAEFVRRARARLEETDLADRVSYELLDGDRIPAPDASFDRVICKNVLEYVPDVTTTLGEMARVLRPGGLIHLIDSDWGFVIVEPWGKARVDRFFEGAAGAFKEPHVGRKLPAALTAGGFTDLEIQLRAGADTRGGAMAVLTNMAAYIKHFDALPADEVDAMMQAAADAVERGEFLFVLPQFLVTATRQ